MIITQRLGLDLQYLSLDIVNRVGWKSYIQYRSQVR